jgi:hypothetical protein
VFTTIQKFMPAEQGDRNAVLSARRNIVVIADEAHRSQYDFIDGFARHMRDALPQASFARTNTRREHARGLRRLHQHLRHPASGRRWRHGADLLGRATVISLRGCDVLGCDILGCDGLPTHQQVDPGGAPDDPQERDPDDDERNQRSVGSARVTGAAGSG